MAKPKKILTTCHVCEETTKSEVVPQYCPRCGANLLNPQCETVLKKTHCQFHSPTIKGNMGYLYLTNLRLVWVNTAMASSYGMGLVGMAVGTIMTGKQSWGFSLPVTDLVSFEDSKFGLFVKAFTITTTDGTRLRLSAKPREEWIGAITKAKEQLLAQPAPVPQ